MGHKRSKSNYKRTNKISSTYVKDLTKIEQIQAKLLRVAERTGTFDDREQKAQKNMSRKYLVSNVGMAQSIKSWLRDNRGKPAVEVSTILSFSAIYTYDPI